MGSPDFLSSHSIADDQKYSVKSLLTCSTTALDFTSVCQEWFHRSWSLTFLTALSWHKGILDHRREMTHHMMVFCIHQNILQPGCNSSQRMQATQDSYIVIATFAKCPLFVKDSKSFNILCMCLMYMWVSH